MSAGAASRKRVTIAGRIARELGAPELVDKLIALPASELTSLLLEVTRRRTAHAGGPLDAVRA